MESQRSRQSLDRLGQEPERLAQGIQRLAQEFQRLAQRELRPQEHELLESLVGSGDLWAEGHDPEVLPTLAVALAATDRLRGPLVFLSPEAELLRARQVRFGARAPTWLLDAEHGSAEELEASLRSLRGAGVLWCTLESLQSPEVKRRLGELTPDLVFIESAHAASPLAHELRPSLAHLPALRALWGEPRLVAFTRAAPEWVRLDAQARLGIAEPRVVHAPVASTTRFSVASKAGRGAVDLVALLERLPRPTIVFCATPRAADTVFAQLTGAQLPVHRYHGGMSVTERATEMLHFTLPGRRAVMVATSAFHPGSGLAGVHAGQSATPEGLGLGYGRHKARSLVHCAPPLSLEQYALELSVLGEDEESEAVLWVEPRELVDHEATLAAVRLRSEQVQAVGHALIGKERCFELAELEARLRTPRAESGPWGSQVIQRSLYLLQDAGVVRWSHQGIERVASEDALLQVTVLLSGALDQMRAADRERFSAVRRFLTTDGCRHSQLAAYWGDPARELVACGRCDVCHKSNGSELPAHRAEARAAPRRAPARSWSTVEPSVEVRRSTRRVRPRAAS